MRRRAGGARPIKGNGSATTPDRRHLILIHRGGRTVPLDVGIGENQQFTLSGGDPCSAERLLLDGKHSVTRAKHAEPGHRRRGRSRHADRRRSQDHRAVGLQRCDKDPHHDGRRARCPVPSYGRLCRAVTRRQFTGREVAAQMRQKKSRPRRWVRPFSCPGSDRGRLYLTSEIGT